MDQPKHPLIDAVYRVLRYLKSSPTQALFFSATSALNIKGFCDTDWAGCPTTRCSIMGFYTFLGHNIISWCAKKQLTISHSSTEAEYRATANTTTKLTWLTFLLCDL